MDPDGDRGWGSLAFMAGLAALVIFSVVSCVGNLVVGDDRLRYVAGDRPVFQVSSGPRDTDRWLEWELPAGGPGLDVTYEGVGDRVRRPATLRISGFLNPDGGCAPRAEWDVSVDGDRLASGLLHGPEAYDLVMSAELPQAYPGLPITIAVRRVDGAVCAASLHVLGLWIAGERPGPLPPYPPSQILIDDGCRDDEPCPRD